MAAECVDTRKTGKAWNWAEAQSKLMLWHCAGNEDKLRVFCGDDGIGESVDELVMLGR